MSRISGPGLSVHIQYVQSACESKLHLFARKDCLLDDFVAQGTCNDLEPADGLVESEARRLISCRRKRMLCIMLPTHSSNGKPMLGGTRWTEGDRQGPLSGQTPPRDGLHDVR